MPFIATPLKHVGRNAGWLVGLGAFFIILTFRPFPKAEMQQPAAVPA